MKRDISKNDLIRLSEVVPRGKWKRTIIRHDGRREVRYLENIVTAEGLNALASRGISDATTFFNHMAVGTVSNAASLGSTVTDFGEVDRKVPTTITSSKEVFYAVATWGGSVDGVTSLILESAALVNHVNSGQGISCNIVNGLAATLANSDFLHLEVQVQVGSHNL